MPEAGGAAATAAAAVLGYTCSRVRRGDEDIQAVGATILKNR